MRYGETDQMGVAYHAHYLVWCELARTELMRQLGVRYRDLEERGFKLAVAEASLRYAKSARYDDLLRITAWISSVGSRRVVSSTASSARKTAPSCARPRLRWCRSIRATGRLACPPKCSR